MKRMVITGLPCPASAWESFLGSHRDQRILPIREVFEKCELADPREMAKIVTREIEMFRPRSILCHDLGVPLTLLSLLHLQRTRSMPLPRVTVFNGAVRRVNILKAHHPMRFQFMTTEQMIREVNRKGGAVDLGLKPHMKRIRAMYRLIVLYRVAESVSAWFRIEDLVRPGVKTRLKAPMQIIASPDDPYMPVECVRQLEKDFHAECYVEIPYGHFPYSIDPSKILPFVERFEAGASH